MKGKIKARRHCGGLIHLYYAIFLSFPSQGVNSWCLLARGQSLVLYEEGEPWFSVNDRYPSLM